MELKCCLVVGFIFLILLLIVPYGIEITERNSLEHLCLELLIVPYGIEISRGLLTLNI